MDEKQIKDLGEDHRCPASQVAGLLLIYGLAAIRKGDIELDEYKVSSRSPRYDWNLDFEVDEFDENPA